MQQQNSQRAEVNDDLTNAVERESIMSAASAQSNTRRTVTFLESVAVDDECSAAATTHEWTKERNSPNAGDAGVGAVQVDEQAPQLNRRFYRGLTRPSVLARMREDRARRRRSRANADEAAGEAEGRGSWGGISGIMSSMTAQARSMRDILVTATLVGDQDEEVAIAERMNIGSVQPQAPMEPRDDDVDRAGQWWRKPQYVLLVGLILVFGGAIAVMSALLASNDNDNVGTERNTFASGDGEGSFSSSSSNADALSTDTGSPQSIDFVKPFFRPTQSPAASKMGTLTLDSTTQSTAAPIEQSPEAVSAQSPATATAPASAPAANTLPTTSSTLAASLSPTITLYYPDWLGERCINEFLGRPEAEQVQRLFKTMEGCCKAEFRHLEDKCIMNSLGKTKPPTLSPSMKPTLYPKRSPSMKPTLSPSRKPINSPSRQPMQSPSEEPTRSLSINPITDIPTPSPGAKPTNRHSDSPTKEPSPGSGQTPVSCHREVKVPCCAAIIIGPPLGFENAEQYCLSLSLDCDVNTIRCNGSSPPDGCHEQARVRCCRATNVGPPTGYESAEQFCLFLDCDIGRHCNGSI